MGVGAEGRGEAWLLCMGQAEGTWAAAQRGKGHQQACFQGLRIPPKVAGLCTLAGRAGVTHGHRGADRGQPRPSLKSLQGLWSPQLP